MLHPHLTQNPDGSYTVIILHPDESGSTIFKFADIEYARHQELTAYVKTDIHLDKETFKYEKRLNTSSGSGCIEYGRILTSIVKNKQEFHSYLNAAIVMVNEAIKSKPRMIDLVDAPRKKENDWLLEPFILDGTSNILFGEGGGGKTFIALRWMLSLATGIPFLGVKPKRIIKCMFLDYEDESDEGLDRLYRLCGSKLMTPDGQQPDTEILRNIKYFNPEGIAFHDLVPTLKELILANGIEFILIDSAVSACGGEPEKAEIVGRFFNSLKKLGVTTLTIAHETKSENHEHVFGSIFWRNFTRNMWNAQSEKNPVDDRKISFGLFHRKCNHAGLRSMVPLRVFHGAGFVDVIRGNNEEWGGKSLSLGERITAVLRSGPKQFGQIVEALREDEEVKKEAISLALNRMNKRGVLSKTGKEENYWEIAK